MNDPTLNLQNFMAHFYVYIYIIIEEKTSIKSLQTHMQWQIKINKIGAKINREDKETPMDLSRV